MHGFSRLTALALSLASVAACSDRIPLLDPAAARIQALAFRETGLARAERARQKVMGAAAISSGETLARVEALTALAAPELKATARIGILYFLDRPAHRLAVLKWLADHNAKVGFEDQGFGYVDADLAWTDIKELIKTSGNLGLDESSLMKLELDAADLAKAPVPDGPAGEDAGNTSLFGPVHSAGYGAKVEEFRAKAAADLGLTVDGLQGQGSLVAIYDGGIDLSRTDVFQERIKDFVIGDDRNFTVATETLAAFQAREHLAAAPTGLEDLAANATLRFTTLSEAAMAGYDFNGSGAATDELAVAVYAKDGHLEVRVRAADGLPFGDALRDFGDARQAGLPVSVDLYTGKYYVRTAVNPSPAAAGVKLRQDEGGLAVAFVGTPNGSDHGIANLHMVGGDYTDRANSVRYHGVAPRVEFLAMQTWTLDGAHYGEQWIPLARTIIQAARAKADVIDLDIYTPGTRGSSDLLKQLTCRVTAATDSIPVVAAHNFGPLPDTVQNLAQGPCVLAIGASHSVAALHQAFKQGSLDPEVAGADDNVQTAIYSGRGFAMNGQVKPDIISPAYGYTAYGAHFIRFSGTSGATPTTAGMLALLKQAARIQGRTLDLTQARFLLQSSSIPVTPEHIRDGAGYSDLAAAWELLKTTKNAPFQLTGPTALAFEDRPNTDVLAMKLTRAALGTNADGPEPMHFWIEYGGASGGIDAHWLKFYDWSTGTPVATFDKDAPMTGETQDLRLYIDLPEAAWNALPPGDHVALVKGVRKSLASGRNVDFMMPVTIAKGARVDQATYDLKPLFAEQYQIFTLSAEPGDTVFLEGITRCLGTRISGAIPGNDADALGLVIDNQALYPHGGDVMNTYAPLVLTPAPVHFVAQKKLVRFAVMRRGQLNCDGPIGGALHVRRAGFTQRRTDLTVVEGDAKFTVKSRILLGLTGGGLSQADLARGLVWNVKAGDPQLAIRQDVDGAYSFTVPAGVARVRVLPASEKRFQGVLLLQNEDGSVDKLVQTRSQDSGGFASFNQTLAGTYTGLELTDPTAGESVHFIPASEGKATIELVFAAPADWAVTLKPDATDVAAWLAGDARGVTLTAKIPTARPATVLELAGSWNFELQVPFTVEETMPNGTGDAGYLPVTLWKSKETVVVPLR